MHTAEGARTYQDLGHYFQNYNNQVSSHVGIDDTRGTIGEYVTRGNAAWTQAYYNDTAVAAELCGFAAWSTAEWKNNHHDMLVNAADWVREECNKAGLPMNALNDAQAQGTGHGCCQHINLGAGGGGHVDCGPGFPWSYVLDMAKGGSGESTTGELSAMSNIILNPGTNAKTNVAFPAGAKQITVYCDAAVTIKIDWRPGGSGTMTPNADNVPRWNIPPDARAAIFQVTDDAPGHPISLAIG
jgi:hypothetical protein